MVSCFELLSIELLYELFDYMSSHEILYTFIGLNYHLNTIINSYPLQIDFRTISRTNFDFVCQHLQPKQVISLIFSEKNIPDQVKIFHQNFPHFQHQFIHLQNVVFIKTETILLNFPFSVSRLTFQSYSNDMSLSIKQILIRHAKFLTHIKVNDANILQCINTSFPELKHLIINGGGPFNQSGENSLCSIDLYSSITHLYIFITKDNVKIKDSIENFEYLSYCLTHLSLVFSRDMNTSFELLQHYFIKLNQLTHLTIKATGELDLINGQQWEKFISKTRIIKFNFQFILNIDSNNIKNEISVLESFRSSFWLEEKHWYVAFHRENLWSNNIIIYSIPRFRPRMIEYPIHNYPPFSTIPLNLTQRFFYDSKIHHLSCYLNNSMILPNFRFTQVRELDLSGSIWTTIDGILSIVDLNQIRKLDITKMGDIPINKLNELLIHTSHLYHLVLTNFNPLLILPSHIRCLTFRKKIDFIDIDACCTALSCVERVELPVESEEIMIELINRVEYLHHIVIFSHIWSSLSDITIEWFQQNSSRLKTKNFTYQFGNRLFPEIHFSFTNK